MNKELGTPNLLIKRIKVSKQSNVMLSEKYGNIRVSWSAKEEYFKDGGHWSIAY